MKAPRGWRFFGCSPRSAWLRRPLGGLVCVTGAGANVGYAGKEPGNRGKRPRPPRELRVMRGGPLNGAKAPD
jgi:hypothetical protein